MQEVIMNLFRIHIKIYFMYFKLLSNVFIIFPYGKSLSSFVYVVIFCVDAGITTLMSPSDDSDPYFFRRKMEKTRPVNEE